MLATMSLSLAVVASQASGTQVTVYNQGFALVKEQRRLTLRSGVQTVAVEDVAAMIEPTSVGIRSLSAPGSFRVLEQNYQYDLISTTAILNKAVGKEIVFNRTLPNGQKERVTGTLMSAPTATVGDADGNVGRTWNGMVIRTDDGRILLNPSGEIEVASIPEGLISRPTLNWMVQAAAGGENDVELSYITQGMSWKCDYVLSLDQAGKVGEFQGWVTMTNNSGTKFQDATLKLLAGEVNRAPAVDQRFPGARGGRAEAMMDKAAFEQEQFGDYHLYTLERPATLRDREIKQISLMEASGVPVTKRLVVDPFRGMGGRTPDEGEVGTGPIKPLILIEVKNDKASKLGMPLPMGTFKVFQRDRSGSVQLLGETRIDHTPREEKLSLAVGRAFDVVAQRKRTAFEWIRTGGQNRGARESFEVEVRNRKETPETVEVFERFWGQFEIKGNTHPFDRPEQGTIVFKLELAPNEVKTVKFSVETRW